MKDLILEALHDNGPLHVDNLAASMGVELAEIVMPLADLMVDKQIHLEIDGTVWFAQEVAA